ncbi:hypothetical protein ACIOD2_09140 [Amycolatopsis sp. NPDC088138]|uniref:hypothetical protein n=1 Tax=Amycolatopsis sp. NPDC088138 TaxID=3363938 RepID=UPI0038157EBC
MIEDFLVALRAEGRSRVQSIRALREREGCSLAEAKEIVHTSRAWADLREDTDRFHASLERTLVRDAVLRALHAAWSPVAADDLAMVVSLVGGPAAGEATLAELAAEDRAAYFAGEERPVWICPALEYPNGEPNDEFFTRSDWPSRGRTVREVLSETQELWLLRVFCGFAMGADPIPPRLAERIDDLTIHLPAGRLAEHAAGRGETVPSFEAHREVAADRFGVLVGQERVAHQHVYEALDALPEAERLFGRPSGSTPS